MQPHARQRHGEKRGLTDVTVQVATWQDFDLFVHDKADRRWRRPSHHTSVHGKADMLCLSKDARGPGNDNHHLQVRSTPAVKMAIDRDFPAT
jgi:hypothetical protein